MSGTARCPAMTVEATPRMESNHRADQNSPVILVVDDERVIADTLSVILNKHGFTAMTAYNGTSALEIATLVPPQLLISDVMMPGMGGIDLAVAIRAAVPNCEVILFSGLAFTADLLVSARLAGLDFVALTKPVHPTEMLSLVSERLALREEVPAKQTGTQAPPGRDRAKKEKSHFRPSARVYTYLRNALDVRLGKQAQHIKGDTEEETRRSTGREDAVRNRHTVTDAGAAATG